MRSGRELGAPLSPCVFEPPQHVYPHRLVGVDARVHDVQPQPLEVRPQLRHVQGIPLGQEAGDEQVLVRGEGAARRQRQHAERLLLQQLVRGRERPHQGGEARGEVELLHLLLLAPRLQHPADPAGAVRLEVGVGAHPRLELLLERLQVLLHLARDVLRHALHVRAQQARELADEPLAAVRRQVRNLGERALLGELRLGRRRIGASAGVGGGGGGGGDGDGAAAVGARLVHARVVEAAPRRHLLEGSRQLLRHLRDDEEEGGAHEAEDREHQPERQRQREQHEQQRRHRHDQRRAEHADGSRRRAVQRRPQQVLDGGGRGLAHERLRALAQDRHRARLRSGVEAVEPRLVRLDHAQPPLRGRAGARAEERRGVGVGWLVVRKFVAAVPSSQLRVVVVRFAQLAQFAQALRRLRFALHPTGGCKLCPWR